MLFIWTIRMKLLSFLLIVGLSSHSFAKSVMVSSAELPYQVVDLKSGLSIHKGGFGSDAFIDPRNPKRFYAVTDRGPNADSSEKNTKIFPLPTFNPSIGYFQLEDNGLITELDKIVLRRPDGTPLTGLPNPKGMGSTGESAIDMDGNALGTDPYGLDSEGLVVDKQGNFWVSDEYGPHIVKFDSKGIEQERISPIGIQTSGRKLPAVLANRRPNRGMEGLAITPDGKTLVGIMQSTLNNPSRKEVTNRTLTRIVTFDIETGQSKQYLYRQNDNDLSNSALIALDNHRFLVNERDSKVLGVDDNVQKHVYFIDLLTATEVSGDRESALGLLINGKTLEQNSWEELEQAGIKPVSKKLIVDIVKEYQYPHEKFEGMWLLNPETLMVINDDDFGIKSVKGEIMKKILPITQKQETTMLYRYSIVLPN